jgi:hypothetical protein
VSTRFPHLFTPLKLNHVILKNRIVFGAHTANMAETGLPGAGHLQYDRKRALGGAAMIVVEPVPVHPTAVLTRGNFRSDDDAVLPHLRERQLQGLGVALHCGSSLEADDLAGTDADVVVVATGSRPAPSNAPCPASSGFPPSGMATSLRSRMSWRAGYGVTGACSCSMMLATGVRSAPPCSSRERLPPGTVMAPMLDLRSGRIRRIATDSPIDATCNRSEDSLFHELHARGIDVRAIGDCVAPRYASNAIFEGRRLGLSL